MKEDIGDREVIYQHGNRNRDMNVESSTLLLELSSYNFFHSSSIMLIKIFLKTIYIFHPCYFSWKSILEVCSEAYKPFCFQAK